MPQPAKPWVVMCRVSGGLTGTRGPTPLKLHGVVQRFASYDEAQRAAADAKRAASPHAVAFFEYWPEILLEEGPER